MKKLITLLTALAVAASGMVFAQNFGGISTGGAEASDSYADRLTYLYAIEDKYVEEHPSTQNVKLSLEFTPLTGEVRFFYECLQGSYDQGEAMNTALHVFEDIKGELGFKHYDYRGKDRVRNFKDKESGRRMSQYSSYVRFSK